jgi:glucokinase
MTVEWLSNEIHHDLLILAGDVGGTNTSLALVGTTEGRYTIIAKTVWPSGKVRNILLPVFHMLEAALARNDLLRPSLCCISAAGPVAGNRCIMTNCQLEIHGSEMERETGIETLVINDFYAISSAIPITDIEDRRMILKIPHMDGSCAVPGEGVKLVIGPGTGLGVGYLVPHEGEYIPFASEGGHSDFAAFDDETWELREYLTGRNAVKPGVEPFVSGQGIVNIYHYYRGKRRADEDGITREIDAAPDAEKPALISRYSREHGLCHDVLALFVKMLGSFAGSLGSVFLPTGGIYLAGGIPARNEHMILENNLFMRSFEENYNPAIASILKKTAVYLVRDYSISLYGAAAAARRHFAGRGKSVCHR